MNSRYSLLTGLVTLGFSTAFAAEKPNIILILADDLGYGDLSCFNEGSKISTPNIDALSRQGVNFTDAHASSSLSTPSRYSILTGRYSWRTPLKEGVGNGYSGPLIAEGRSTVATMLSKCGYNTACIGKWHLGWDWQTRPGTPKGQVPDSKNTDFGSPILNGVTERGGFDYFFGISASLDMPPYVYVENDRVTAVPDRIAEKMDGLKLFRQGPIAPDFDPAECLTVFFDKAKQYISGQSEDKPFFLYLPLNAPHTPILPSEEYEGRTPIGPYGDYVVMVDDLVGQLIETLKSNGQWENTIVIFTSDNGFAPYIDPKSVETKGHYPSYKFRGYKTDIYEGGHRVPLIVTYGDRFDGFVDSSLVCLTDFYSTFADMAGYKIGDNEAEDSYSFWGNLTRKGHSARRDMVTLSGHGYFAMRIPELKLVFWCGSGGQSYPSLKGNDLSGLPEMQLYNIDKDISEKHNLINDPKYKKTVRKLTAKMRKYVNAGRSTPGKPQKNETGNNWKQTELF